MNARTPAKPAPRAMSHDEDAVSPRRDAVLAAVGAEGLLGPKDRTIAGRLPTALVDAAKARSGIQSDSELLLYALARVALEDDYGRKLLALKGTVPRDVDLGI